MIDCVHFRDAKKTFRDLSTISTVAGVFFSGSECVRRGWHVPCGNKPLRATRLLALCCLWPGRTTSQGNSSLLKDAQSRPSLPLHAPNRRAPPRVACSQARPVYFAWHSLPCPVLPHLSTERHSESLTTVTLTALEVGISRSAAGVRHTTGSVTD